MLDCSGDRNSVPFFDEQRAFTYLVDQCEFGPRVPNSPGHRQCKEYLYQQLSATSTRVNRQDFTYYDTTAGDNLLLTNLIASYNVENKNRILLCAHWDTRPWADNDPDSSRHREPVLGANDGASGVAVLLEIANGFKDAPPPLGIDIVFFDGEDYGMTGTTTGWLLGSKFFTRNIGSYRPYFVVLSDMVGDADLNIYKEHYSQVYAGWLVSLIWEAARRENAEHFYPEIRHTVYDDHVPFLELGIPAADLIDMDYKWWHTVEDTPDKCSPASLREVGRVVLRVIYDERLRGQK